MSAGEMIEHIRRLPQAEKREIVERIWEEFGEEMDELDPELTPEQTADLDRRAEEAIKHPERCRPLDDVLADLERQFAAKG